MHETSPPPEVRRNKYRGYCVRCGARVAVDAGILENKGGGWFVWCEPCWSYEQATRQWIAGGQQGPAPTAPEPRAPARSFPRGELWQPCLRRGCEEQPSCLDCEYCSRHCRCGG